jgi:hypothetical protein
MHPLREMMEPQLILPLCMNHARMPGVIREVHPCECCHNFVARQEPSVGAGPPPPPAGPEVKYIPLGNHQFAIVDAANFAWLNRHRWFLLGGRSGLHYACRIERGKTIYMHREIMQTPPGMVVDHLNHNPVDNREGNLENRTQPENARNTRRGRSQSGFAGVYPYRRRWKAQIFSGGKIVYREIFDDPVEAAKARDRKAYELFGSAAYLNFPDEILKGKEATG